MGGDIVILSFWGELEKIAEERSLTDRALAAAPAAGAVAGGVWGAADPRAFNPSGLFPSLAKSHGGLRSRAVSGLLGAGLGATTGWLPSVARDAYRAMTPSPKLSTTPVVEVKRPNRSW